jgi:uncharacterized protein (DUF1015 family)
LRQSSPRWELALFIAHHREDVDMVDLAPLHGLRYSSEYTDAGVFAPPYDVIDSERHLQLLAANPHNIVRLILGETPSGRGWHARAAETMARWIAEGVLVQDRQPALYGYQQHFVDAAGQQRTRTGVMGRVRLSPYGGPIRRHERTRIGPRIDRLRLTRAVRANLSPVFGLYRDPHDAVRHLLAPPEDPQHPDLLVDIRDDEGVRHVFWRIGDLDTITAITAGLADREIIIADGHHRYETALAYQAEQRDAEGDPAQARPYDYALMYLAAAKDPGLYILPTHRVILGQNGRDPSRLVEALRDDFDLVPVAPEVSLSEATSQAADHTVAIGLCTGQGQRWVLRLKELARAHRGMPPEVEGGLSELDVSVLQNLILAPHLGIDTETLARTEQVMYTIDEGEACSLVASGEAQAAFILNPTRIEQVWNVAEQGLTMPQKSTYFYPKLLTGLVINPLDER